jgi:hypothetical protein
LEQEKQAREVDPPDVPVYAKLPVPSGKVKPWWTKYRKNEIVPKDTEMVSIIEKLGKGRFQKLPL